MLGSRDFHIASQLFQPPRLTLARELRSMTKSDLASVVNRTTSAVSQFESGKIKPDASTLASLAMALGVSARFFAYESNHPSISLDSCHFRSLRSASQRSRRQLLAVGTLVGDLVGELQRHVQLPEEQIPVLNDPVTSTADIERRAIEVRKTWGLELGPIGNMTRLLEAKGAIVRSIAAGAEDVDAFSYWHQKRPLVFLVTTKGSPSRARFDAAHELGHLVMHVDASPGSPVLEREANYFAGAFLLPKNSFVRECPSRFIWSHFCELKRRWKVSIAAMVKRGHQLGQLSDASYRRAFTYLNRTKQRLEEPFEPEEERPALVARALGLLSQRRSLEEVANSVGLELGQLMQLAPTGSESDYPPAGTGAH